MRGADSGRLPLSPITTSELLLSNLPLLKKIPCFFDSVEAFGVQLMLDEFLNFFFDLSPLQNIHGTILWHRPLSGLFVLGVMRLINAQQLIGNSSLRFRFGLRNLS